jgi:hypothetical protein
MCVSHAVYCQTENVINSIILVACFLSNRIYSQETTTKIFDCGFGVRLDTEVYPNIPITFEIPSNYLEKYETDADRFAYIYKSGEISKCTETFL